MENFYRFIEQISSVTSILLIIFLIGGGLFLTVRLGFFQFKYFPHIINTTFVSLFKKQKRKGEGSITPFQAATSAMASTIGAANIVGVPVAIAIGGPGAIFWMWIVALIGMATKYSEVVLGMKYRVINKKGDYVGGPMYYIDKGLGWKWLGTIYALVAAVSIVASVSVQTNSLSGIMNGTFKIPPYVTGIVVAALAGLVLVGGIKTIGKFAEKMIPSMALLYIVAAVIIVIVNINAIPATFALIFKYAFTTASATGGFVGAAIVAAIQQGVARGLYSNEAGNGSAAIAHAGAINDHPAKQGFWGVFEVFFDTIVICTLTAVVIISTGAWKLFGPDEATNMPGHAMEAVFGNNIGHIIISICIFTFAFTTILVICYFGEKQTEFIFGYTGSLVARTVYIAFIFIGAISSLTLVWSLLDILFALAVIPNMIGVIMLSGQVKSITSDYFDNHYKINQDALTRQKRDTM